MIAYKFLRAGAVGPFSGFKWPTPANGEPGSWVDAGHLLQTCANGIHACTRDDLAFWLDQELWRIELSGRTLEADHVVVARQGRLVTQIHAWDGDTRIAFAEACAGRTRAFAEEGDRELLAGYLDDVAHYAENRDRPRITSVLAFIAAGAAEAVRPGGFEEERAWQATWLANRLGL